jgi:hypothetical protein
MCRWSLSSSIVCIAVSDALPPARDAVYLDAPYLSIRWESGGPWLFVEWRSWARSPEFRAAYEVILVAMRENRASKLLIDLRKTRVLAAEDQQWLVEDWGPRSVQAGVRSMAVIIPERALENTILESIDNRIPTTMLEIRYFGTPAEARAWLS